VEQYVTTADGEAALSAAKSMHVCDGKSKDEDGRVVVRIHNHEQ
jgi:hypothetical protein